MRPRVLVLVAVLFLAGYAVPSHSAFLHLMNCQDCHKVGTTFTTLDPNNVCLQCHGSPTVPWSFNPVPPLTTPTAHQSDAGFAVGDASNAMGSYPATATPGRQTSHIWAAPDSVPAAGALPPTDPLFSSKYGTSRGKVTCSRCHNPHGDPTNPKLLRLGAGSVETMCLDCHRPWQLANRDGSNQPTHALQTHPQVADYPTFAAANPTMYKYPMDAAKAGSMALVDGVKISCSTCHGVHFADSDRTTADGVGTANSGDGHLLRSDGPTLTGGTSLETAQLRSNLCQACHIHKLHGNDTVGMGCLDCHGGHAYDPANPTQPNYYILKPSIAPYKTTTASWFDGAGNGFCEGCHDGATASAIPVDAESKHMGFASGSVTQCAQCHNHQNTSSSFGGSCNACHGYAPSANVASGPTGYAVDPDTAATYADQTPKSEATTPHINHADKLDIGAAGNYKFDCQACHGDFLNATTGTHRNGVFRDVPLGNLATQGMSGSAYASAGTGTCSNIYCHSNGGKRTGDATRTYKANNTGLIWAGGRDTISSCSVCHGNDQTTMGATERDNSTSHAKHLARYSNDCSICHFDTATGNTALKAGAIGGTHVDGTVDVARNESYNLGAAVMGGGSYGSDGTCSIYCHSDGAGVMATPDWDVAASGACGTCHKLDVASGNPITSGSHTAHINDLDNEVGSNLRCVKCHSATVNDVSPASSATLSTTSHVNGAIEKGSCTTCHNNGNSDGTLVTKVLGTDYVWGTPFTGCDDCHGDGAGTSYPTYANGGIGVNANSHAPHISSGFSCEKCHAGTATGNLLKTGGTTLHVNGTRNVSFTEVGASYDGGVCSNVDCHGNNDVTWGQTNLSCGSCHLGTNADVDSFAWDDSKTAYVNSDEWTYSGHGKTTGTYEVTGHAAPNLTGDACAYCHDSAISHNQANFFRLRQNGRPDLNGNCLACHATGSTGVTVGATTKNSTVKIDKYHGGADHADPRDAGRWCWDCHDPHGDASAASQRIQMIQRRAAVNPNANGVPTGLTDTDIFFYNRTIGVGTGAYARTTGTLSEGVCNNCHTTTSQFTQSAGANGHPTGVCVTCHTHSGDSTYDQYAFKASCNGCHGAANGQYWPSGSGGAIPTANDDAGRHDEHVLLIGQRLGYGDYGTTMYTDAQQKAVCAYCHATPGDDGDHGLVGSLPADTTFHPIWNVATADNDGAYAAGNCSNVDCHLNKATGTGTYGWNDAGTSACIMCHRDINSGFVGTTGQTHNAHMAAGASTYFIESTCASCHANGPNWSTNTPPSANHLSGTFEIGGTVSLTYDGTFPTAFGSCGTNRCHNDGKNGSPKVAYTWGTSYGSCTFCHDWTPSTQGHAGHYAANNTIVGSSFVDCSDCHLATTTATHATGTVSLKATMAYNGDVAVDAASGYGTCTTSVCHTDGAGAQVTTPAWDTTGAACVLCHGSGTNGVPATGSHQAHVEGDPVVSSYTAQGLTATASEYKFNCTACHGSTLGNHISGGVNIVIPNWTQVGGAGDTCGQNNCHQNGAGGAPTRTATWGSTASVGTDCKGCHGNSPTTGAHDVHAVGIHTEDTYTGATGLLGAAAADPSVHGDATTTTVLGCNTCHNATVDVWYNDQGTACNGCHDGTPAAPKGNMVITNKAQHVDGAPDVSFQNIQFRTKAQIRNDITTVPELNASWERVKGGIFGLFYKQTGAYDQTKASLNTSVFNPDKTCTTACHNSIPTQAWNTDAGSRNGCTACHTQLP